MVASSSARTAPMSPKRRDPDPPLDTAAVSDPSGTAVEVLAAGGNDRWLTDQHLQVIDLIVAGVHITTIAKTLHVGRSTIYDWRRHPAFAAEESRRREFMRVERGD